MRLGAHKPVTLKDIAADTGYSITTVSHALRNLSDISEATKKFIRSRADSLGYILNASASTLRSGFSKTIAVLLGDLSNPFFAFTAKEIEMELKKFGYSAFFMNTNENPQVERNAITVALSRQVDGIIICPSQVGDRSDNIHFILQTHTPCVLIGRHFRDVSVSCVACDDRKGGLLAGRHVLERGHRHILYVDTPCNNSSAVERKEGVLQAFQEFSEPVRFSIEKFDENGDYLQTLLHPKKQPYTVLIAFNDLIAWDVLCRIQEYGLRVPQDISLIAFDNLHSCLPLPFPLTSISSSKVAMPRRAVKVLMEQIQDANIPFSHITLDVELIDRNSVRSV